MNIEEYAHTELKRLPRFELSYETICHKKVSTKYDICLAIPFGKKAFLWYTFKDADDVCFIIDLNKEKRICKSTRLNVTFDPHLSHGTILYGTVIYVDGKQWFIIEDIHYYRGVSLKKSKTIEKFAFLEKVCEETSRKHSAKNDIVVMLPVIWKHDGSSAANDDISVQSTIPAAISSRINYHVHHIQYRSCNEIMPYLNIPTNKKMNTNSTASTAVVASNLTASAAASYMDTDNIPTFYLDFTKSQYKYHAVFQVTADIQFDIYHLFAYGKNTKPVYYNIAYVPNYKSSMFLNGIFRKIRENSNLDYIEESDDEEEFQKTEEDRYVDIKKVVLMECQFHYKFKKWVPIKVVDHRTKVVHIDTLVKYQ